MKYCIDTCSFIELGDSYRPTVFPRLLASMEELIEQKRLHSPYEVYEELKQQEDDAVFKWVKERPGLFIMPRKDIQLAVKSILKTYPLLINYRTGKSGADPWVIATAQIEGLAVVTEEQRSGDIQHPKIPDVCEREGIRCMRIIEFLENEHISFT